MKGYHIKNHILILAFSLITLNLFPQTFVEQTGITLPGVSSGSVAWGDYNNDGYLDILLTGYNSISGYFSKIYRNKGDNTFEETGITLSEGSGSSVAWGDYDNDGNLDILLTGYSSGSFSKIYHNNGDDTFTEQSTINLTGVSSGSVAWGDYDNDGYLDIILTGNSSDGIVSKIYRNNGNNTFTEQKGISLTGLSSGSVAWGDYDNDGYLDILMTGTENGYVSSAISLIYHNNGNNTFTKQTFDLTGVSNSSVAWGDYDNDGDLDILLAGYSNSYVPISEIYRNDGSNIFTRQTDIVLQGVTYSSVAWGDYDNDGDLDILLSGYWNGGGISIIYRNDGSNIFTEETGANLSGVYYGSAAWGDYNMDGKLDILLTGSDNNGDEVSKIYRNQCATAHTAPATPSGLTATCTASSIVMQWDRVPGMSYNVRVGTSSGAGNVVSPMVKPSTGTRLKPGLGNAQENNFYILRYPKKIQYSWSVQAIDNGFASSAFAGEQNITFPTSLQASQIFADIVQGSSLTLHWTRGNGSACAVFVKEGNSGTALPVNGTPYPANTQFGDAGSQIGTSGWYCVYDGTGNSVSITGLKGLTNYVFQVIEYDAGFIYYNQTGQANPMTIQTSVFTGQPGINLPGYSRGSVVWGDYDNDGYLDILFAGYGGSGSAIYRNNRDNTFINQSGINNLPPAQNGAVAWGDFDNDGDLDILFTGSGESSIYRNNGDNSFSELAGTSFIGVNHSSAAWCDFDNDGDLDLILAGSSTSSGTITKIYRNNGNSTFTEQPGISLPGISDGSISCGDYNNDGYIDILLTGNNISKIYRNNGNFTFTEQTGISLPDIRYSTASWGDYDNDGYLDILLTGDASSDIISKIYRNNGNNTFTEQNQISLTGVQYGSVAWGDYDNDGDLDILLTGELHNITFSKIYRNDGSNTFSEQTKINLTGVKYSSVSWADYDNDGDLDILLTGDESGSSNPKISVIYRNDILTKNVSPSAPQGLTASISNENTVLSWDPVTTDATPANGLSYNIRVGSSSGGSQIKAPMASGLGILYIPAMGNCQHHASYILKNLLPGTYYWSVQAIDNGFAGGVFAAEKNFTIESIQASKLEGKLVEKDSSALLIKWKKGNGQRRVVFCKQGSTGTANPVDNAAYFPDPIFGYGDQIGTSGWYSIYNGRSDSTTIYGLTPGVAYSFQVIEYSGSTGSEVYYRTAGDANPGIFSSGLFSLQSDINIDGVAGGSAAWGDYDNDGLLDILLTRNGSKEIYRNNSNNTFTRTNLEGGVGGKSASWGDYDNDGKLDILMTGYSSNSGGPVSEIYHNDGDDTFTDQTDISLIGVSGGSAVWGDYDNDGKLDILLSGGSNLYTNGRISTIYHNDGGNSFTMQTGLDLAQVIYSSSAWGDYDNDGYLDFILTGSSYDASHNGPVSIIYHNNGDKTFTEQTGISLTGVYDGSVAWGDYDNDGDLDILIAGSGNLGYIALIYRNNGDNTFTQQTDISLTGVSQGSVAWGDYDNDGYLDILLTGGYYTGTNYYVAKVYHNNGDNTFTDQSGISLIGVYNSSAVWGDYDNDGDLDILLSGNSGGSAISKIYRNNTIMKAGDYAANKKPAAPGNLLATPQPDGVKLSWSTVTGDETPYKSMTYNLRVGTVSGGSDTYSSNSDNITGYRRLATEGNAQFKNTFLVKNLSSGTYYWSVQAVDQGFKGGEWSPTGSFTVKNVQAFFESDIVCQGLATQFTDQSITTDGISSWKWYFKDGTTSDEQDPSHTYSTSGTYKVKLVIKSIDDVKDSLEQNVIVLPKPVTGFTAPAVCVGTSTNFTNTTDLNGLTNSPEWYWNLGDGESSSLQSPGTHKYSFPGTYSVKLQVLADNGCTDSITQNVVVASYPNAVVSAIGALSFCTGDSVNLSVPSQTGSTYQWKNGSVDIIGATLNKLTVKTTSGTYKAVVTTTSAGCVSTTADPVAITVNQPPASPYITTSGSTTFCQGDSVTLFVPNTTGYTFQWKLNGGAVETSYQYTAKSAGTYSITMSNSSGCTANSTNNIIVTVNAKPTIPTVSLSGATSFCEGGSVELSVINNTNYTYQWQKNSAGISGALTNTYVAQNSGVYSLKILNSSGCIAKTENVTVTALSTPTAPSISLSGSLEFCQGDSAVLSVTNTTGYKYDWKLNGGAVGTDSYQYTAKSAGSYSLVVSNSSGCTVNSTNTKVIIVDPKPTLPTVSISGATSFCEGGSVELSVINNTNYTYQWEKNGAGMSGALTNTYVAQNSGIYSLKISSSSGCTAKTENVTVKALSAPTAPLISAAGSLEFCQGDSTVLSVTNTTGYTYDWKLNGGSVGTDSYQYTAKSAGSYSLVVSNSSGCTANSTNTKIVIVDPKPTLPVVSVSGPKSFCQGGSVELSVVNNSSYTYQWENNGGVISGALTSTYIAQNSGVYALKISNSTSGCITRTENVTVNSLTAPSVPSISAGGPLQFCQGDSVSLSVTNTTGYTYQWKLNGGSVGSNSNKLVAKNAGSYNIVVSNANSCSASSNTVNVVVNSLPALSSVSLSGPTTFCSGGSITLSIPSTTGYLYNWRNEDGPITGANTNSYLANTSAKYQLDISNSSGCVVRTSQVNVVVKPMPVKPTIVPDNYQAGKCLGENPIRLNVGQVVTGYNYQWNKNGIPISNATSSYYEAFLSPGDYSLEAELGGCKSQSDILNVYFENAPEKPFIYAQGPAVWFLVCSNDSASQYKWYYNGSIIQGADKFLYVANRNLGKYYVSIANSKGCFTLSDVITIPTGATGIENVDPFSGLKIYPNPSTGQFTLDMDNQLSGEVMIRILDQGGKETLKVKLEKTTVHFSSQIDLSGQPKGLYLINIMLDKYSTNKKIIIE